MSARRRIDHASLTRVALPVGPDWSARFGGQLHRSILCLRADDGTSGHAELAGDAASFERAGEIAAGLIGADAFAPRIASRRLQQDAPPALAGAIETALLDLMAGLLDAPLAELLGGRRPAPVASAGLIDLAAGPDACILRAGALAPRGHAGFALLAGEDPAADAAAILALREELGPEAWLALFGDRRQGLAGALVCGRATEMANLAFIADPVATPDALRRLRRDVRTPIASTWPVEEPAMLAPLMRGARLDALLGGCTLQGPLGFADLAAVALAYQRDLAMPPLPGCGLALAADLHLAAATRQLNHPVIDTSDVIGAAVLDAPPGHEGGAWTLPSGPGIGSVPGGALLAAHAVELFEVPAP